MPVKRLFRLVAIAAALAASALAAIDVDTCDTLLAAACTFDFGASTVTVRQSAVTADDKSPTLLLSARRKNIVIRDVVWEDASLRVLIDGSNNRTGGVMRAGYSLMFDNVSIYKVEVGGGIVTGGTINILRSDVKLTIDAPLTEGSRLVARGGVTVPRRAQLLVQDVVDSSVLIEDFVSVDDIKFDQSMIRSTVIIRRCSVLRGDIEVDASPIDSKIFIEDTVVRQFEVTPDIGLISSASITVTRCQITDYLWTYPLTDGATLLVDSCTFGGRGFTEDGEDVWPDGHAFIDEPPLYLAGKRDVPSSVFGNCSVVVRDCVFDIVADFETPAMAPVLLGASMSEDSAFRAVNLTVAIRQGPATRSGVQPADLKTALVIFGDYATDINSTKLEATRIHAPGLTAVLLNTTGVTVSLKARLNVCVFEQKVTSLTTAAAARRLATSAALGPIAAAFDDLPDDICSCGTDARAPCLGSVGARYVAASDSAMSSLMMAAALASAAPLVATFFAV